MELRCNYRWRRYFGGTLREEKERLPFLLRILTEPMRGYREDKKLKKEKTRSEEKQRHVWIVPGGYCARPREEPFASPLRDVRPRSTDADKRQLELPRRQKETTLGGTERETLLLHCTRRLLSESCHCSCSVPMRGSLFLSHSTLGGPGTPKKG